jgi:hypothetical protein
MKWQKTKNTLTPECNNQRDITIEKECAIKEKPLRETDLLV